MRRIRKVLILILVAGGLVVSSFLKSRSGVNFETGQEITSNLPVGTNINEQAPDFKGTTSDGEDIQLSRLRGQIVVLNAFASWCGPCRVETPHLVEISNKNPDTTLLGLNQEEKPSVVTTFKEDFSVPYQLILNEDGRLNELYPLRGLPTTWFIDPNGIIRYVHTGPMTVEMMQKVLSDMRAGREPSPFP